MSRTILVAGGSGQVARAFSELAPSDDVRIVTMGRPDLDILDSESIRSAIARIKPDLIINAAAYTAVDQAESDEEAAFALNRDAPGSLAESAAAHAIPIIHISTDYVFDGSHDEPYVETDPVAPLGVYGASKLAGEQAVRSANPDHMIFRTAWVYSPFGKNFVKTMLKVGSQRDELTVVHDQIGNPTSAHDIAAALSQIAVDVLTGKSALHPGIYHLSGTGAASWAEFADFIFETSASMNGPSASVRHIPSSEYPTPVTRPANSRLNCGKLKNTYDLTMPDWRDSAHACVKRLVETGTWSS